MPVILSSNGCDMWLDDELHDEQALLPLLAPYAAEEMTARAVSRLVNNPKSEGAELIA
jgi:putative SOS response-associated peptidase YedK